MFPRNNVKTVSVYAPSIASAGSVMAGVFMAPAVCEIVGLHAMMAAGTLTSGWSLNIYKNASATDSRIATTGSLAATTAYLGTNLGTYLTTTKTLLKLAAGDIVLYELTVVDADTTIGTRVSFDYIYGYVE